MAPLSSARRWLPWVALGAVLGLVAFALSQRPPAASAGVAEAGTCEAYCLDREADCAATFATQGGFPPLDWSAEDRASACFGSCLVLRRTRPPGSEACLD
ncbi:MAG: hypothetical protein FJ102_17885 [Deltaproteobacteria bacterium]|nr:hypothetical protein [Deltaproteobacteria bacterium]